jgi:hypothetical protein
MYKSISYIIDHTRTSTQAKAATSVIQLETKLVTPMFKVPTFSIRSGLFSLASVVVAMWLGLYPGGSSEESVETTARLLKTENAQIYDSNTVLVWTVKICGTMKNIIIIYVRFALTYVST